MRYFGLLCALSLSLLISGCGNVFFRSNFNNNTQTASGVVSVVQLTVIIDGNNVSTQVTVVTLVNNFVSSTESFCGDQMSQFPLNEFAQATFTPGQPCSNLVNVVIKLG